MTRVFCFFVEGAVTPVTHRYCEKKWIFIGTINGANEIPIVIVYYKIINIFISKDYKNVAEGAKLQVAPNSACSRFQRDKLNWNNLQLRTFNSSFSNAFCIKIFMISDEDIHLSFRNFVSMFI